MPPATYSISQEFTVDLPTGNYALTAVVFDPAEMETSLRFATSQYWNGVQLPIGFVGLGQDGGPSQPTMVFDNPAIDLSLQYVYPQLIDRFLTRDKPTLLLESFIAGLSHRNVNNQRCA